jgi:hypothetical protein
MYFVNKFCRLKVGIILMIYAVRVKNAVRRYQQNPEADILCLEEQIDIIKII